MGKYSVKNINDFIYRSKEDSIFLHHIKTLFTEYMAEEKSPYEIKPLVEAHDRYEIVYLVSGKVGYRVDGVDYSLGSGDILIIPPGKIHRVCISTKEDYDRYNIQFHSDLISSPAMHLNNLLDELLNIGSEYG